MKHALLITAYTDFAALEELIGKFDDSFAVYIHIDKKSKVSYKTLNHLSNLPLVRYISTTYKVNWGGINHLKSYLLLCQKALEDKDITYLHLITGTDYPTRSLADFKSFVESNSVTRNCYMDYFPLPNPGWEYGGVNRLEKYNYYDVFDAKTKLGNLCIKLLLKTQRILHIKRPILFSERLFGGSTYWTLPREAVDYVLGFTKDNPSFFKQFEHSFCAEEIYFQTVLLNSSFSSKIINDNLRYTDWQSGKGGYPAFLDETDFETIIKSKCFFARKITSATLKQLLTQHCEK